MEGRRVRVHKVAFDHVSHVEVPSLPEACGIAGFASGIVLREESEIARAGECGSHSRPT
jgi:hypothetical protein